MSLRQYISSFVSFVLVLMVTLCSATLIHAENSPSSNNLKSTNLLAQRKKVEKEIGRPGVLKPGDVFFISLPRKDLRVRVKGTPIRPRLALGGWTAFKQVDDQTMVMGDLVLEEKEIQPVMSQLIKQGIQVTALHNHLLGEIPRIMYLHIDGHGNAIQLAKAIRSSMDLTGLPKNIISESYSFPFDTQKLDNLFRHKGTITNGIYNISIPRLEKITENGMEIPPAMGVATSINFQPTENKKVAITGDFVLTAEEVNPVASTLRKHGIEVTAIHNHMLTENPRLFFMHFWAHDQPFKLANALREVLDKTNSM
ncbi:DUF1259 domain-containing protein [Neobacillus sp. NRS-1170]|uniref:DUF1259 domain-containing protein n=1 Tax=Neobacillus sp. NRS-1170 TaxID=3233898 RepID=UPI003D27D3CB